MAFQTVEIDGGLDLKSSPIAIKPGRLWKCRNFEVAFARGIRRIDGYVRFDGGQSPAFGVNSWAIPCQGVTDPTDWGRLDTNFFAGGQVVIEYTDGRNTSTLTLAVVFTHTTGLTTGTIYAFTQSLRDSSILSDAVLMRNGYKLVTPFVATAVRCSLDTCYASSYNYPNIENTADNPVLGFPTVQALRAAQVAYYNITRSEVQEVPGQGSVLGLYWLKDDLYAVRDYLTLLLDDGNVEVNPGDIVYQGASLMAATFSGTVISFSAFPTTGNPDSALLTVYDTSGTATVSAINNDTTGAAIGNVESLSTQATGAGLYRARGTRGGTPATRSWEHRDLGYSVSYKDASEDFPVANRLQPTTNAEDLIQATPWFVAGGDGVPASTWRDAAGNLIDGSNPAYPYLVTNDGDTTYVGQFFSSNIVSSTSLWINNFGITDVDIPLASIVTGIEFEVTRRCYREATRTVGEVRDNQFEVKFSDGSGGVQFGNIDVNWPRSSTTPDNANYAAVTYGGTNNLLGYSVSPSKIIGTDFGFRFSTKAVDINIGESGVMQGRITMVRFRAHYIPPQGKVYFWNGTSAVIAEVVQYYKKAGDVDQGTASGVMYLMNLTGSRQVGADEEIRSYPGDGVMPDGGTTDNSVLLASTSTSAARNMLDPSQALFANESKYQGVTGNFYATEGFDAIYGVSGAGPAFMYDGQAFSRIHTGLQDDDEKPRHCMIMQSRLHLGYESGIVQFSSPGEPLSFDPLNYAGELGIASAVRGMYPLNGDSGAVFTQGGVQYVKGDLSTGPYPSVISPDVGCVEYTAHSMGQYLYTSFRGCQNLRSTSAYGDFDTSQFSSDVWDWLRPRVQTPSQFNGTNIAAINAIPVRNKAQYRLCFADGYVLTATFLDEGVDPQYTMQFYTKNDGSPMVWDVTRAAVESTGRDRIFGAMYDGSGYVYEIDVGNSFDGANINASASLVVDDQKAPYMQKQFTDCNIHGIAIDYATFSLARGVNYVEPDPSQFYTQQFGSQTVAPTGIPSYFMSASPVRIAGRNVIYEFISSAADLPGFSIQAISYNVEPMAEKRT